MIQSEEEWRTLEAALTEAMAVLEWVEAALSGEEVCDFAESYSVVRKALEVREERDRLRRVLVSLTAQIDEQERALAEGVRRIMEIQP